MPINSKQKGKRGELEWVNILKGYGFHAERTQQFKGTPDSFDVISHGPWPFEAWEVKLGYKRLNVSGVYYQAREEAGGKCFGVYHRQDREDGLVTMKATDFLDAVTSAYDLGREQGYEACWEEYGLGAWKSES